MPALKELSQHDPCDTFSLSSQNFHHHSFSSRSLFGFCLLAFMPISNIYSSQLTQRKPQRGYLVPPLGKICALVLNPFQLWVPLPLTLWAMLTSWKNFCNWHDMPKGLQPSHVRCSFLPSLTLYLSSWTGLSGVWMLTSPQHLMLSSLLSRVKWAWALELAVSFETVVSTPLIFRWGIYGAQGDWVLFEDA